MKSVLVLLCVLVSTVAIGEHSIQRLASFLDISKDQLDECTQEHKLGEIDMSKIQKLIRNEHLNDNEKKLLNTLSCFVACIFEKSNIMQNDKIQLDSLLQVAEKNNIPMSPELKGEFSKCVDNAKVDSDKCDVARAFTLCMLRQIRHG